jgi:hypothetical protein
MASPVAKTFEVLSVTSSASAVDVLLFALDSPNERISDAAVSALISRRTTRGQVEIIRRLENLTHKARAEVESRSGELTAAFRHSVVHGDEESRRVALEFISATENYDQLVTVLELLYGNSGETHGLVAETFHTLVNRLYEHCHPEKGASAGRRSPHNSARICENVLKSLSKAAGRLDQVSCADEIVEAVLILGDAGSAAVKSVLSQTSPACRERAGGLLLSSKHPGVMRVIFDSLSLRYPHSQVLEALESRDDPEFVCELLRWYPKQPAKVLQANLWQVNRTAWLSRSPLELEMIPPGLQATLVGFVSATGLEAQKKTAVHEWIVRHGASEGRRAAQNVLTGLDQNKVQNIVLDGLDSDDADLQAWATGQLRSRGVPQAVGLLIERLDSPMEAVREAAREELESFNLELMLDIYDEIDATICLRAGELLRKTDSACLSKLIHEMEQPIRRKRIRAARASLAMGMHAEVVPALVALIEDSDTLVRRTAAEVLGTIRTPETCEALQRLLNDSSPRVRAIAATALKEMMPS